MKATIITALLATAAFALQPSHSRPPPYGPRPGKWIPGSTAGTDNLAAEALSKAQEHLHSRKTSYNESSTCTADNVIVRKEWSKLRPHQQRAYIRAVQCLQSKPSISGELAPGARNRYDDFVATHINQTLSIHSTGNFLTWHRYFVHTYEAALRNECDYHGYQPYVNWGRYTNSLIDSPLFDGSGTSIGSNGIYEEHATLHFPSQNDSVVDLPPAQGGGCITSGPFSDHKVNLGPLSVIGYNTSQWTPNPRPDGLGYNPRCLRRDLSVLAAAGASDVNSTKLITDSHDIAFFQDLMQNPIDIGIHELGVHTAGHYMISGEPGGDLFASPGDPWFWLHHAQIDRTYWMWQMRDIERRTKGQSAIAGTITILNRPPSRNATLDDRFDLGVLDGFEGLRIKDALSTVDGPFCYVYQ